MEKIYKKADEEHVAAFIVYGRVAATVGGDNELFGDSAFSKYLDAEEVYRAYLNNCLIIRALSSYELRPVACQIQDDSPLYTTSSNDGPIMWSVASNDSGDGGKTR